MKEVDYKKYSLMNVKQLIVHLEKAEKKEQKLQDDMKKKLEATRQKIREEAKKKEQRLKEHAKKELCTAKELVKFLKTKIKDNLKEPKSPKTRRPRATKKSEK